MDIQQKQTGNQGSFFIEANGQTVAELTFITKDTDTMIIVHTGVDDSLRGKNIGQQLVKAAVEYARTNNQHIIPRCTFAKSVIEQNPEFKDVLV